MGRGLEASGSMLSEHSSVLHYLCQRLHIQTPEEREAENTGKEDIFKRDRKKVMVSSHSCSVRQTQGWSGNRVDPGLAQDHLCATWALKEVVWVKL